MLREKRCFSKSTICFTLNISMKYAVITFGCRVNQADSIAIERELRAMGAESVDPKNAELVVVNTCSVTSSADQGARQVIRKIARSNPKARIVATGCYATRASEDLKALPNVVQVVSNTDKYDFLTTLNINQELTTSERFGEGDGPCGETIRPGTTGRTGYTLRVQTGCDEVCAYCVIPSTRGVGKSVPLAQVLDELDEVATAGFNEVTVTGVHLGSYGRDLKPQSSLLDVLRLLDRHRSTLSFRISSLEPMDCSAEVLDLVVRSGRFAPHFHLPLQHASDAMLTAMRRPYTSDYYRRLVTTIRERLPHAGIGSDIIVGFPGETDADAEKNLAYLNESPLTYLHVFPYSDRPGTTATSLPGKVPGPSVRQRGSEVRMVGARLSKKFRRSQVGTVRPGLTISNGKIVLTDNYLKIQVQSGYAENQRVKVLLTNADEALMVGRII